MDNKSRYISTDEKGIKREFWFAVVMAVLGVGLFITSFFVPPMGVIDATVLAAGGEVLTFSGSIIGIDSSYKKKRLQYFNPDREHND